MINNKIKAVSKAGLVICAVALSIILVVPMWRIELNAPQYPEGLKLLIFANRLSGNVDIINGLNHYIGMKNLYSKDFIEFTILPYIIIFFAAAFILTAVLGKRKLLNILFILFVSFGVVAMIDFWRWEYNYGHHLNPEAAIIVPGMAYQPPLIGFKQLLNFGAYSIPDLGGWIFVAVGAMLLSLVIFEWNGYRKSKPHQGILQPMVAAISIILFSSCTTEPQSLKMGKDHCAFCKMTISDNRYGAEIITRKGKVYKFDDAHCILSFLKSKSIQKKDGDEVYFSDFTGNHMLIKSDNAFLLQSDFFRAPMNGNIAAFSNQDSLNKIAQQNKSTVLVWKKLMP